jgi:hypothetical protein
MFALRRFLPLALSSWCFAARVDAQTLGDDRAPAPDAAELDAIEQAWRAAETQRRFAIRHTIHLTLEVGGSVTLFREFTRGGLLLRREPSLAALVSAGARYGVTPAFEVHGRAEIVAPLTVSAIDASAYPRVAMTTCEGQRVFDLATATAAAVTLDAGFRVRVLSALSPFYVGASLRLSSQFSTGGGTWSARCLDDRGATVSRVSGQVDASALVLDVGAGLETGFRFGEREAWDVGIRMTVQALGTNEAGLGGAQLFLGWSL